MNNDIGFCVEQICDFPTRYKSKNKSPVDLVKESGYLELYHKVTKDLVVNHLRKCPEKIKSWILFSQDIRHNPAWSFGKTENQKWEVTYSDSGEILVNQLFNDEFEACAKMIYETIDNIRKMN